MTIFRSNPVRIGLLLSYLGASLVYNLLSFFRELGSWLKPYLFSHLNAIPQVLASHTIVFSHNCHQVASERLEAKSLDDFSFLSSCCYPY